MSIATRIESVNDNLKNAYKSLENLGVDLENSNKNLQNLSTKIDTLYDELPQISDEGTTITLNNTKKAKIKTVLKGNSNQFSTTGKNLFNGWEEGQINTTTGEPYDYSNRYRSKDFIEIQQASNYYFSNARLVSSVASWFIIFKYDENKNYLGRQNLVEGDGYAYRGLININDNETKYIKITEIAPLTAFANTQLEQGSTATTYEPYTGGIPAPNPEYPYPVNNVTGENSIVLQNENLLNENKFEIGSINANTGVDSSNNAEFRTQGYIRVNSSTYYTLSNQNYSSYTHRGIFEYDENYNYIQRTNNQVVSKTTGFTLQTTSRTKYVRIRYIIGSSITNIPTNMKIQLEEGSTATEYVEHQSQTYPISLGNIELCKIGDYQDYIYYSNGNWYKKEYIGKVVLDGSEDDWTGNTTASDGTLINRFAITGYLRNATNICICNYFTSKTNSGYAQVTYGKCCFRYSASDQIEQLYFGSNMLLDDLKTWLSTHNTTVYYVLATANDVQITDETLITQLNDIYNNAHSYNGVTNITTTYEDGSEQMIINASALKD